MKRIVSKPLKLNVEKTTVKLSKYFGTKHYWYIHNTVDNEGKIKKEGSSLTKQLLSLVENNFARLIQIRDVLPGN